MRISEVLSPNRDDIELREAEAPAVGKGGKKRTVFFTDRALGWIRTYLSNRTEQDSSLCS